MSKKQSTAAAAQFAQLGIPEADWTSAMSLAVRQKWSSLPVEKPVAELRRELAQVAVPRVPSRGELAAMHPTYDEAAVVKEEARLKRNAAVHAWRQRNQLQAALDARELRFAAMRAKRKPAGAVA
jgi:hypothetical protein